MSVSNMPEGADGSSQTYEIDLLLGQNRVVAVKGEDGVSTPYDIRLHTEGHDVFQQFDISEELRIQNTRLIGGKDSKHKVFAVEVGDPDTPVTFVVNPQTDIPYRANTEYNMLKTVKELGFLSINPIAIATRPGDATKYLITEYASNLHAYTELAWRDGYLGSEMNEGTLIPALHEVAGFFYSIHSKGITHGDAQLKNIVMHGSGEFVMVDLENGQLHDERDEDWALAVYDDFKSLISSLWHVGYLQFSSPNVFAEELTTHFYDEYMKLVEADTGYTSEEAEVIMNAFVRAIDHALQIERRVKAA